MGDPKLHMTELTSPTDASEFRQPPFARMALRHTSYPLALHFVHSLPVSADRRAFSPNSA